MKSFTTALIALLTFAFALSGTFARGADTEPAGKPAAKSDEPKPEQPKPVDPKPPVKLTLTPRGESRPVLKHLLLPPLADRRQGNAVVLYNKIGLEFSGKATEEMHEKLNAWADLPLDKLPLADARKLLESVEPRLKQLHIAARRENCDWELPIREQKFAELMLPEVQNMRGFARLIVLQARVQIAEGKYDAAVDTLQTGFAMARHVSLGPTLINGLVGLATVNILVQPMHELIERADGPNLYWALASLPHPLIDIRHGLEGENLLVRYSYPGLYELDRVPMCERSSADIKNLLRDMVIFSDKPSDAEKAGNMAVVMALAIKNMPAAKARLLERGKTEKELAEMQPLHITALDAIQTYEEIRDRHFCWSSLPFWQAWPHMCEAETQLVALQGHESIPLATMLLPAVKSAAFSYVRTQRQLAALRNIEALRLHAAANDGKLPARLSDVKVVPTALDPVTGREFFYQLDGDVARLEFTKLEPTPPNDPGLRYELRVK